jgi:hypothetical protein
MSAYTSLKLSRGKVLEILYDALKTHDDDELKALVNHVLERKTLYNCYAIVHHRDANDDERLGDV